MSDFALFFPLGIQHITDIHGIDHIIFITALTLRYMWNDWKRLLILITAFTIGHSLTLALSTLDIVSVSRNWTEFFIAITIIITAIANCFTLSNSDKLIPSVQLAQNEKVLYFIVLLFGLIHGLGFSTLLKSMLGRDQSITMQLFAFNVGIEAGQLLIVTALLTLTYFLIKILSINRQNFILFVSGGIVAIALQMAIERLP